MKHGTLTMATTGGCHDDCCRPIATRYKKLYRLRRARGFKARVPIGPSLRKVRALQRLGHTRASIAAEMEVSPQSLSNTLGRSRVRSATAALIDEVFWRLEMKIPPDTRETRKTRAVAVSQGWLAPMAYDDIEQGVIAESEQVSAKPKSTRFDLHEITYVMQYRDWHHQLSPLEKSEVVRRWVAGGRSEAALCRLTGWREGRYHLPQPEETS